MLNALSVGEEFPLKGIYTPDEVVTRYQVSETTQTLPAGSTGLICRKCSGEVITARVAFPLHIKGQNGRGYGHNLYVDMPYCPGCEPIPMEGTPLEVSEGNALENQQLFGRWWVTE